MTIEELGRLYPIMIVEYSHEWPKAFEKEKAILAQILGLKIALRIEHIGSTAVPGVSAKPTVDILVEIPNAPTIHQDIMKRMTDNGYIHMKEQQDHLMFVKGYTPTGLASESFHVHMGSKEQGWLWDRVAFRDYLRRNLNAAKDYEKQKIILASKYKYDREAYTEGKEMFIKQITGIAKNVQLSPRMKQKNISL